MTEGCWYHLLITCTVESHELVCPENLTHKDKQLRFQSMGICDSISKYCWQDGCPSKWLQKTALQIRPNFDTTWKHKDCKGRCSWWNFGCRSHSLPQVPGPCRQLQHNIPAPEVSHPDEMSWLILLHDSTHPISQCYNTPTWTTCPSTLWRTVDTMTFTSAY